MLHEGTFKKQSIFYWFINVSDDLLVQRPLTAEVLATLVELTKFENLVPRYSATVPPCWSEMQQEQQQRRHPQHLHRHGEATQHTRTWRLQQDRYVPRGGDATHTPGVYSRTG